jgi:hypothetical protein
MKKTELQKIIREEVRKVIKETKQLHEKTQEEINAEKDEIQAAMKSAITQKKALDLKMKVLRDRLNAVNAQKAEKPTTTPTV